MTTMAFEEIEHKLPEEVKESIKHWKREYKDIDFFIASFKGKAHICGTNDTGNSSG